MHNFSSFSIRVYVGRDSLVGIATHYGLDSPGIETWWGRDCPLPPVPVIEPIQRPVKLVLGVCFGGEAAEAWR